MKLWALKINEDNIRYDMTIGFIVRADTAEEARKLAGESDEGWGDNEGFLDPEISTCDEVKVEGIPGIVFISEKDG